MYPPVVILANNVKFKINDCLKHIAESDLYHKMFSKKNHDKYEF